MNAHAEFDTDRVRIHVHHAHTWWQRARGLIAHPEPRHGAGMFFPRTNAVHGIGMAHALDIVFLDQGEDGARVSRFLQRRGLALDNVLLDSKGEVGRHFGLRALPATLFYGRDGSLQDIRIGALSKATLQERIERLRR